MEARRDSLTPAKESASSRTSSTFMAIASQRNVDPVSLVQLVPVGPRSGAAIECRGRADVPSNGRRGSGGQSWTRRRRTGKQACEASGGDGSLGRKPIYQGLHPSVRPTAQPAPEVGMGSLTGKRNTTPPPQSPRPRRARFRPNEDLEDPPRLPPQGRRRPPRHARHRSPAQPHPGRVMEKRQLIQHVKDHLRDSAKGASETGAGTDHPLTAWDDIEAAPVTEHVRTLMHTCWRLGGLPEYEPLRLRAWTHTLGYRGHILTKSR